MKQQTNGVSRTDAMSASWIYPFIILGGALQTCGAAMNAQLFQSLGNKWLANAVSFVLILAFFICVFAMFPHPLPTMKGLSKMPWWAPLGGLVGAVQVYAGLTLVQKVGAGAFIGTTVTAALIMSLLIDHYGWLRMPVHAINPWRIVGALVMVCGIVMMTKH